MMNVARGIDTVSYKRPLGVCAGVAPFNFPAMIPLWMFPIALATGNTYILKTSERVPTTSLIMARLSAECNFPKGIFNVLNGGFDLTRMIT